MTFAEKAPVISKAGVTKTQAETYFSNLPEKPEPQPEPKITKAKIVALADKYYDGTTLSQHGGVSQVASDVGLTVNQVKTLVKEFNALYSDWNAENNPVNPV